MSKYKIDISFYSPLIYFFPPILDSIVLNLAYREKKKTICCVNKPGGFFGKKIDYGKKYFNRHGDIPLTSRFIPNHAEEFFDTWKKRFDTKNSGPVRWGKGRKRISVKQGKYRSYDMKIPAKAVKTGHFLLSSDNIEEIERLLDKYLFAIGKKRSMGYGIVDKIGISSVEIKDIDILKKRPVPLSVAKVLSFDGERLYAAYKPPYWLKSNITECVYCG